MGSLVCCSPWGHKELDTTYLMNKNMRQAVLEIGNKKRGASGEQK